MPLQKFVNLPPSCEKSGTITIDPFSMVSATVKKDPITSEQNRDRLWVWYSAVLQPYLELFKTAAIQIQARN